ncbi:hypothetical protein [Shewanella sp. MBTL60-007]|uniref:hypothetical protein n=1 Tax=Shewanella sp. MBTL60-007 TaxID=2815911 RepID=UPI001BC5E513|nr:hypothetical protein [Shewanella sp. MBTL60-007]GIU13035.1 hypothetical protein TUM3792_02240 [Shewanella sp. MBTL60-007]
MTHLNTMAQSVPAANTPAFDLSNPQHLAMRKLMADIFSRHANAVSDDSKLCAERYLGIAFCLERVALQVLNDDVLAALCLDMGDVMSRSEFARQVARAAA